jgi:CRISPR/Cas system-associated protein Cas7 (RAMP superfamily)
LPDNEKTKFSKTIKKGTITKIGKQKYNLDSEGVTLIDNITSFMIESEQNSTRNFSAMLRHRMNPKFIVEMIGAYASISSFHKVIGKVLNEYIEESEIVNGDCPQEDCGGTMVMTEGCMKCPECGYAHCG